MNVSNTNSLVLHGRKKQLLQAGQLVMATWYRNTQICSRIRKAEYEQWVPFVPAVLSLPHLHIRKTQDLRASLWATCSSFAWCSEVQVSAVAPKLLRLLSCLPDALFSTVQTCKLTRQPTKVESVGINLTNYHLLNLTQWESPCQLRMNWILWRKLSISWAQIRNNIEIFESPVNKRLGFLFHFSRRQTMFFTSKKGKWKVPESRTRNR
jgi:hypothetical protein